MKRRDIFFIRHNETSHSHSKLHPSEFHRKFRIKRRMLQLKKYIRVMRMQDQTKYFKIYVVLVILRVCLVFLPQTGYIHPDEFFQSVEIATG